MDVQASRAYTGEAWIQTVTGRISPRELGWCQCHEHLLIARGKPFEVHASLYMEDLEKAVEELQLYKAAGGCSLVDAQPAGCGRMARGLISLSNRSGVHIVASTGFHKLIFYPEDHWIHTLSGEQLTALFTGELEQGLFADGDRELPRTRLSARAGLIKAALDAQGLSGRYLTLFKAAAEAAVETGAPLMCHIEKGADASGLIRFLTAAGVHPGSVILCHLDRAEGDLEVHRQVARAGVFLEYDTISRPKYHDDRQEIAILRQMLQWGFGGQMLLSLDTTRERLKSYGGKPGLDYIATGFRQQLREDGVQEKEIRAMMVGNPQKALAFRRGK